MEIEITYNTHTPDSSNNEAFTLRKFFELNLLKKDASEFETFFTELMKAHDCRFQQVKPHGNRGDGKNDGYIKENGTYFQVYAPENVTDNKAKKKLKNDFDGLYSNWHVHYPIKNFFFVINDKSKGISLPLHKEMAELEKAYPLITFNFIDYYKLLEIFDKLPKEKKGNLIGFIPPSFIQGNISYSCLNEVITHIMDLPFNSQAQKLIAPDFLKKIQFNLLSDPCAEYLTGASRNIGDLEIYFRTRPHIRRELQQRFSEVYESERKLSKNADTIFFTIFEQVCPRKNKSISDAVMVLMAFYFESCDIFEEPK